MGEINQKQFSPARVMSVQSEVSTPMTRRSETWPDEKESSASSDQSAAAPPRIQLIKVLISIVLLVGVVALAGMFYGISEVVDDIRALSAAALSAILIALLANALAAVLRFKIIATAIEYPVTIRRAVAAVSAGSLAGALFFQIAGQLMARGYIAGREGIPFAAVVVCISACDGHVGHSDLCPWRRAADRRVGGHHGCTFFCRITLRVDCRYFRAPGRLLSASDQRTENTLVDRLCRHSLCCANSGWIRSSSSGRFADGVIDTRTPGQHHRRIELVLGSSRFWRRPRCIPQSDDIDTRWATARYSFDRCLASG